MIATTIDYEKLHDLHPNHSDIQLSLLLCYSITIKPLSTIIVLLTSEVQRPTSTLQEAASCGEFLPRNATQSAFAMASRPFVCLFVPVRL